MSARRAAVMVGVATVLVAGPAWAVPQPAPAVPSHSELEVLRIDPDDVVPGGSTTLHAYVANLGPDTTGSAMIITVDLPPRTQALGDFYPEDCEPSANKRHVRCEFPAGLRSGRSATALVPILVDGHVPVGQTLKGSFRVSSPDDRNVSNNRTAFEVKVVDQVPDH
ncbi:hypothetical protein WDV06_30870 [Streptomyces racemochromogenes]|uniref:DUF11 domain-containing protein n=1 Tax=Streptomyces racemochromogenes TaxID=67353 RepID=A0ABW7PM34_9ACTN